MNTWPQYCSPDVPCAIELLQYHYCSSQMTYEPQVCQPGYFCTRKTHWNASSTKNDCPEGKYCKLGTETPTDCGAFVRCKAKSANPVQYGMFLFVVVTDAALVLFMRKRAANQQRDQAAVVSKKGHRTFRAPAASLQDLDGAAQLSGPLLGAEAGGGHENHLGDQSSTFHLVRGFTRARGRIFSLDFVFDNLGLILPSGNAILQSVSARVKPGCVTAIMGPSGAGKTTLLNTLMGKVDPSFKQTGELRINGKIRNIKDFRSVIGFVPQDDIMIRELTVRDNIEFAARVRLPPSWTEVGSPADRHGSVGEAPHFAPLCCSGALRICPLF